MSAPKYAKKVDNSQGAVVDALRNAGYQVHIVGQPVDLMVRHPSWARGMVLMVEVKSPANKKATKPLHDKRQEAQDAFIAEVGVPVVWTAEGALQAVSGAVR